MTNYALVAVGATTLVALPAVAYYGGAYGIRLLADTNILFTYPKEATAKAIMTNGQFSRFVMSLRGHRFAGELDETLNEIDKWEIVSGESELKGFRLPLLTGIRYVGLPPFSEVHRYHFTWTSLEEEQRGDGGIVSKFVRKDLPKIDYVYLREDVYVTKLETAECSDNIPLDADILIGGRIVNPYKALFRVEKWLAATNNAITQRMRSFFGNHSYEQLRKIKEAMRKDASSAPQTQQDDIHDLSEYFKETFAYIENEWGFRPSFVQIYSIDPGSKLADEFIRASTQKYVAEQKRDANIAEGQGLAARDTSHFSAVAGVPGGPDMFKWTQIRDSKLTTYVEGGSGVQPVVPVGQPNGGQI